MDRISGSIPFPTNAFPVNRAAQAYGVRPVANAGPVVPMPATEPIARIGRTSEPRPASDPSRLVAAKVEPIDLANDVAAIAGRPSGDGAYALYRHPADRNQAATGIALGRSLDVQG